MRILHTIVLTLALFFHAAVANGQTERPFWNYTFTSEKPFVEDNNSANFPKWTATRTADIEGLNENLYFVKSYGNAKILFAYLPSQKKFKLRTAYEDKSFDYVDVSYVTYSDGQRIYIFISTDSVTGATYYFPVIFNKEDAVLFWPHNNKKGEQKGEVKSRFELTFSLMFDRDYGVTHTFNSVTLDSALEVDRELAIARGEIKKTSPMSDLFLGVVGIAALGVLSTMGEPEENVANKSSDSGNCAEAKNRLSQCTSDPTASYNLRVMCNGFYKPTCSYLDWYDRETGQCHSNYRKLSEKICAK